MHTESADYRKGFAAGRDDARSQMDALYDQNYRLESELNELRARAQRLEAILVLTEDQRDKALKERDEVLAELARVVAQGDDARSRLGMAIETLRLSNDGWAQAINERDAAIAERDALREQLNDLQAGMRQWEDGHASAVAKIIAERDALRKQLDELRSDYADNSYWGKK